MGCGKWCYGYRESCKVENGDGDDDEEEEDGYNGDKYDGDFLVVKMMSTHNSCLIFCLASRTRTRRCELML